MEKRKKHLICYAIMCGNNLKIRYLPVNVPLFCLKWSNLINLKIQIPRLLPISLFFFLSFLFYQVAVGRYGNLSLFLKWQKRLSKCCWKPLPDVGTWNYSYISGLRLLQSSASSSIWLKWHHFSSHFRQWPFPYARIKLWKRCSLHMHYSHGKCVKNSLNRKIVFFNL